MPRRQDARRCPRCGMDIATGEGERSCGGGVDLPLDLGVCCETCQIHFFVWDAN